MNKKRERLFELEKYFEKLIHIKDARGKTIKDQSTLIYRIQIQSHNKLYLSLGFALDISEKTNNTKIEIIPIHSNISLKLDEWTFKNKHIQQKYNLLRDISLISDHTFRKILESIEIYTLVNS